MYSTTKHNKLNHVTRLTARPYLLPLYARLRCFLIVDYISRIAYYNNQIYALF